VTGALFTGSFGSSTESRGLPLVHVISGRTTCQSGVLGEAVLTTHDYTVTIARYIAQIPLCHQQVRRPHARQCSLGRFLQKGNSTWFLSTWLGRVILSRRGVLRVGAGELRAE
jgi:hypothetical protein